MKLEERASQLAAGKNWRVVRSYGGALADISRSMHYCVIVSIDGKPCATGVAESLPLAEDRALAGLESWYRVQTMRAAMRLVP